MQNGLVLCAFCMDLASSIIKWYQKTVDSVLEKRELIDFSNVTFTVIRMIVATAASVLLIGILKSHSTFGDNLFKI